VKYAFIQRESTRYPVTVLCQVMGGRPSFYHGWTARDGEVILPEELALRRRMKALFAKSRQSLASLHDDEQAARGRL
jgi:hypothetical protein